MSTPERFLALTDEARHNEVEADIAASRQLSADGRGRQLAAVCRSAWAILRARPDFEAAIEWRDPPAPDFERRWKRWVSDYRERRRAG